MKQYQKMSLKQVIVAMLELNPHISYVRMANVLGCAPRTISYHAERLGLPTRRCVNE